MKLSQIKLFYQLVSHNQRLQERRHPMFEKNKAMKYFAYIFVAFWAAYLMFFGVAFYGIFSDMAIEAFDYIDGGMIFFLTIDFLMRFGMQETPAQNIKQYKLLPIPTNFLINVFLVRMGLQLINFFWFFFFVPFGMLAVVHYYGFLGLIGFLAGWWLAFVANSYWYLLWRTFINRNILLSIIPLAIYGLLIYFGIFYDETNEWIFYAGVDLMRLFLNWSPMAFCIVFAFIIPLYFVNRYFQKGSVYIEISKTESNEKVSTIDFKFLNRFGQIGEYFKLELKSLMRNSVVRKQFITGLICMLMLCSLFAFTDVYDNMPFMRVFICVYCFSCLGVMTLTNIMCAEGNYIDGLMSWRESVYALLRAKYYFHCLVLIVPLLFSIMPILQGKLTVLDAIGCFFFTSGCIFPCLFQMAVYNDSTMHLNEKITKAGRNTKMQMIVSLVALFLPMFVMYILVVCFDDFAASLILMAIGIAGTIAHPIWLRNIYSRFMKRRHVIMAGFRDSK